VSNSSQTVLNPATSDFGLTPRYRRREVWGKHVVP
jgi:hypothetical protein